MRRKLNFQQGDYVMNNELMCFGIAVHETEEFKQPLSPKAEKELAILRSWFPAGCTARMLTRPAYKSDFNFSDYSTRAQVRTLIACMVIRELPVKNFYSRCWLMYFYLLWFVHNGVGRGLFYSSPIVTYAHPFNIKPLLNYPDLFWWKFFKTAPTNPPMPDPHKSWSVRQKPVYHQYQRTTYRYRKRRPRYVQWDGSMNQPVMPFLHDHGTNVPNGTFKRNCMSTANLM